MWEHGDMWSSYFLALPFYAIQALELESHTRKLLIVLYLAVLLKLNFIDTLHCAFYDVLLG